MESFLRGRVKFMTMQVRLNLLLGVSKYIMCEKGNMGYSL